MLNYVWYALIVIGILTAAGRDLHELATNPHAGNTDLAVHLAPDPGAGAGEFRTALSFIGPLPPGIDTASRHEALIREKDGRTTVVLTLSDAAPSVLREVAQSQGTPHSLRATLTRSGDGRILVRWEPVRFQYLKAVTGAVVDMAGTAVEIALGLIGIMAFWLGLMKIAEEAGIVTLIARAVRPLMRRIFPDVPGDHPAVAAMVMNISANVLGLGNAATPFGLKAMEELQKLNPRAGTASNAMVTFLATNTSCITLIPATAIAVRAAAGSADPAIIIGTTLLASTGATVVAITLSKIFQRLRVFVPREEA